MTSQSSSSNSNSIENFQNFISNFKSVVRLCSNNDNSKGFLAQLKSDGKKLNPKKIEPYMEQFKSLYQKYPNLFESNEIGKNNLTFGNFKLDFSNYDKLNENDKIQLRGRLIRCIYYSLPEKDENIITLFNKFTSKNSEQILSSVADDIINTMKNMEELKDFDKTNKKGSDAVCTALSKMGELGKSQNFRNNVDTLVNQMKKGKITNSQLVSELYDQIGKLRKEVGK